MDSPLELAVNHVNTLLARQNLLAVGGPGLDAKREAAWCEYGFKTDLSFHDLYKLYRRGGIAHGAVNKLVGQCWRTNPQVIEGDPTEEATNVTAWERRARAVLTPAFWQAFAEADRRRLVGRYAGLVLQFADGKAWDQPVTGRPALVKAIPVWQNALTIVSYDTDPSSQQYGQPTAWQYLEEAAQGVGRKVVVHPDRVVILGDYSRDAIGYLEPAYNAFVSLEKVEGGSGESFLKNAARQVVTNFDAGIDLRTIAEAYGVKVADLQEKFNEQARDLNRGNDTMLITQGATTTALVAQVADPAPTYHVNLQTAAAALDIPSRILVGNQSGERASTEDRAYFNSRCQARREVELSRDIRLAVEQLMRLQALPATPVWSVVWDDLAESTQAERLANAKLMAEINGLALATGGPIFDDNEIRTTAGSEPRAAGQPLPDDGPDA